MSKVAELYTEVMTVKFIDLLNCKLEVYVQLLQSDLQGLSKESRDMKILERAVEDASSDEIDIDAFDLVTILEDEMYEIIEPATV
jgi:hypothetical protein